MPRLCFWNKNPKKSQLLQKIPRSWDKIPDLATLNWKLTQSSLVVNRQRLLSSSTKLQVTFTIMDYYHINREGGGHKMPKNWLHNCWTAPYSFFIPCLIHEIFWLKHVNYLPSAMHLRLSRICYITSRIMQQFNIDNSNQSKPETSFYTIWHHTLI